MADYLLKAQSSLGGYSQKFGQLTLSEQPISLVSVSFSDAKRKALQSAVKKAFGCDLPSANQTSLSKDKKQTLIWMQRDQVLILSHTLHPKAEVPIVDKLGDKAYFTDQSHAWVGLSLSGATVRTALERTCPVDLDPALFPVGASTRVGMENLTVVLVRTKPDEYLLLSASSSANSFLHLLETSAKFIIEP